MLSLTQAEFEDKVLLKKEPLEIKNKSMSVFDEMMFSINSHRMYFAYHEKLPNNVVMINIHHAKAAKWIECELGNLIVKKHYKYITIERVQRYDYFNVIYLLENELMIEIDDSGYIAILFSEKSEARAMEIDKKLREFAKPQKSGRYIYLLMDGRNGIELLAIENKKPTLDLSMNYNDDLLDVHKHLLKTLNKKEKSGLVLLYGIPGTGKSTYIRYLLHSIKKKVIFISPQIAGCLDSPRMTSLLVDNPNSIFIIEDAEELIKSREGNVSSNISMLLNLTDGMLGESLGIQVICTFNTKVCNIDKALLRKGRLIALYQFKELSATKSQVLSRKLSNSINMNSSATLAEIYNQDVKEFNQSDVRSTIIGFTSH